MVVNGSTAESTPFAATGAWESRVTATIPVQVDSTTVRPVATGPEGLSDTDHLEPPSGKA
ncbi:hypothetical protein A6A08_08500 [Nocardiopsis sp. TSRI0078]|nr:hypothetical protein A6A08_08500 [Nocardiopsis sp. TSRI0078]